MGPGRGPKQIGPAARTFLGDGRTMLPPVTADI
jgi:hypothetical protein